MSERIDLDMAVDDQLRGALDADVDSAKRITRAALAVRDRSTGQRAAAWSLATGLVIGCLALALWLRPPAASDRTERPPRAATLITNHGEVVALRDPAGRIRLRHTGASLGSGPRLVIIKGESDG